MHKSNRIFLKKIDMSRFDFCFFLLPFSFSHFKRFLAFYGFKKTDSFSVAIFCWLTQIWDTLAKASDWQTGCLTSSDYLSANSGKCSFLPFHFPSNLSSLIHFAALWACRCCGGKYTEKFELSSCACVHVCGDQKQSDLIERFHGNLISCCHCRLLHWQNVWLPSDSFDCFLNSGVLHIQIQRRRIAICKELSYCSCSNS